MAFYVAVIDLPILPIRALRGLSIWLLIWQSSESPIAKLFCFNFLRLELFFSDSEDDLITIETIKNSILILKFYNTLCVNTKKQNFYNGLYTIFLKDGQPPFDFCFHFCNNWYLGLKKWSFNFSLISLYHFLVRMRSHYSF